jgi:hypothetical protein
MVTDAQRKGREMRIIIAFLMVSGLLYADFTRDNDRGTVTDNATGLMWQDDTSESMAWETAIGHCESLELGGYADWRLPNLNELTSLVDDTTCGPAISAVFQHAVDEVFYWSATTTAGDTAQAWTVYSYCGLQAGKEKTSTSHYVRCVRSGE